MKSKIFVLAFVCFLGSVLGLKAQTGIAASTHIAMADETKKSIEDVVIGDVVLSFNNKDNVYEEAKVKKVNKILLNRLVRITLENGTQISLTRDYPIWAEKGWVSVNSEMTKTNEKYSKTKQCEIGDFLYFYNLTSTDFAEITIIRGIMEPIEAYSLELDNDGAIVANGFLIGQY